MIIKQMLVSFLYEGTKLEIFISGCKHNCKGCHNPELQDFKNGELYTEKDILEKINEKLKFIDGIVLTGGDPLWNKHHTFSLVKLIHKVYPELKLWLYTGFTKEEIDKDKTMTAIFKACDVVITDRYDKSRPKTDLTGSDNQRIWRKQNETFIY